MRPIRSRPGLRSASMGDEPIGMGLTANLRFMLRYSIDHLQAYATLDTRANTKQLNATATGNIDICVDRGSDYAYTRRAQARVA